MRFPGLVFVAAAFMPASGVAAEVATPAGVAAFVRDRHLTRYSVALSDLNGDHRPEALVYAMATADGAGQADLCGSGGCRLYVLSPNVRSSHVLSRVKDRYRVVSSVSLARPPIRVLSGRTRGWHDLGVWVAGGGITAGYEARLRFDGHRYPGNPTMPPVTASRGSGGVAVITAVPAP